MPLPENIELLIYSSLIPSDLPGNNTGKFYVAGYTELLVRENYNTPFDEFSRANTIVSGMGAYGIHVLPSKVAEYSGRNYTVTMRVEGSPLKDLLRGPDPELITQTDTLLANIGRWLVGRAESRAPMVMDVYGVQHFMRGTIEGSPEEKIWLVDFPEDACDDFDFYYPFNVASLTEGILDAESLVRTQLFSARLALEQTLSFLPKATNPHDDTATKVRQALETGRMFHF